MRGKLRDVGELALVFLFFTAITVVYFYPISVKPGSILFDRWDGSLHTWILSWDVHKLTTGLGGLFDANIFYPHTNALAYSDHLLGSALMALPFLLITGNPILAENAVGLLSFVLSGVGMYLLVRRFVPGRGAALLAGIIWAFCPWRFSQLGHMTQLMTCQWMPFVLLFLHRTMEEKKWGDAIAFGLLFALQALCSYYLAAIVGTAVGTVFVAELVSKKFRLDRAVWVRLVVAGALAIAIIGPTMLPYFQVQHEQGLERSELESIELSADLFDYLAAPPWNRTWGKLLPVFQNRFSKFKNENQLFAGLTAVLLALIGLIRFSTAVGSDRQFTKKAEMRLGIEWEHTQGVYLVLALTALILSLGPQLHIFWKLTSIPLPYKLFYHIVPGFKALRVPTRFAVLFMLALSMLAAFGLRNLTRRLTNDLARKALPVFACGLVLIEFYSAPLPHHAMLAKDRVPEVYRWLAKVPAGAPIAELPQYADFPQSPKDSYDPLGFTYMYYSYYHGFHPIVNGRSGFLPPSQVAIWNTMMKFPAPSSVNLLRYLGVQYLVLHMGNYPGTEGEEIAAKAAMFGPGLAEEARFGRDVVYRIQDPLGPDARVGLKGVEIGGVFVPPTAMPKSVVDLEINLANNGDYPALGFKMIDVEIEVNETGPGGARSFRSGARAHVNLMPKQTQWINIPFETNAWKGSYKWDVRITFPEYPSLNRDYTFNIELGDYPDSLAPGKLAAEITEVVAPATVKPGQWFEIEAKVRNTGDTFWRARPRGADYRGVVLIGIRDWRYEDMKRLPEQPYAERGFLERSIPPGDEIKIVMKAVAFDRPGNYIIQLDLAAEYIQWFADAGSNPILLKITVAE